MEELRKKLKITDAALQSLNDLILDPKNSLINDLLKIVEKYGTYWHKLECEYKRVTCESKIACKCTKQVQINIKSENNHLSLSLSVYISYQNTIATLLEFSRELQKAKALINIYGIKTKL